MGILWPRWYGCFRKLDIKSKPSFYLGPCSHGTAYKFAVTFMNYHYYIVYRKNIKDKLN